jgi:hypothetical protein
MIAAKNTMAIAVLGSLMAACGGSGGGYVIPADQAPVAVAAPAPVAKTPDAYRDFGGEHVKPGQKFRLSAKRIAVDGPNIVMELQKIDWSTLTAPNGQQLKEATAHILLYRGEEDREVLISTKDEKRALGVLIQVLDAGDDYNRQRMTYEPWVELVVKVAAD